MTRCNGWVTGLEVKLAHIIGLALSHRLAPQPRELKSCTSSFAVLCRSEAIKRWVGPDTIGVDCRRSPGVVRWRGSRGDPTAPDSAARSALRRCQDHPRVVFCLCAQRPNVCQSQVRPYVQQAVDKGASQHVQETAFNSIPKCARQPPSPWSRRAPKGM